MRSSRPKSQRQYAAQRKDQPSIMSAGSGNRATVLVGAAIVAALYFGREVLLPMALAMLLSFVLAPLVKLLQRLYLPRFAAVTIVVLLAFGVISGLATLMFAQVSQLAGIYHGISRIWRRRYKRSAARLRRAGLSNRLPRCCRTYRKNSIGQKTQNRLLLQRRTRAPSRIGPFRSKCGNQIPARFKHSLH